MQPAIDILRMQKCAHFKSTSGIFI